MLLPRLLLAALVATLAVAAPPAAANHHLIRITEVFGGAQANPSVQFVELQMYNANQQFIHDTRLHFLTPAGADDGTFTFPTDVANGADNATILAATSQAAAFFGVTPDLTISPVMDRAGGKVEFIGRPAFGILDAFSWGSYSGASTGTGTPFGQGAGGLPLGLSAVRDVSVDTGNSAADFDAEQPTPVNNANQTTSRATIVRRDEDGTLRIEAAPGVQNAITVSGPTSTGWKIVETGAPLQLDASAGDSCFGVSVTQVRCAVTEPAAVVVQAADQNDRVNIAGALSATVFGGTGDDRLTGSAAADALHGQDGNDTLTGARGDDDLLGGIGNDFLDGGQGADDFDGGNGGDRATYLARTAGVTITMDGNPDDGNGADESGGRRDNVQTNVERLTGSQAADSLTGNDVGNQIIGGPGADDVFGLGGRDAIVVKGDGAADDVDCGAATDSLSYDAGLDVFPSSGPGACETANP